MRFLQIEKVWLRILCLAALMTTATGCIKDDTDDCPRSFSFTVRAYADGNNSADGDVNEVILYVFDKDRYFVREIETTVNTTVTVKVPIGEDVHVYAWGNLRGGNQTRPTVKPGDPDTAPYVSLLPDTRATSNYHSPDDIFRGSVSATPDMQGTNVEVPIRRQTGSMNITVRGLKSFAGFNDSDYSIVVRDTYNTVDFYGNQSGDRATYCPAGSFLINNGREEYIVPTFNLFSARTGINIDIMHAGELVKTVSTFGNGSPITVVEGKLTQVVIDFTGTISVNVNFAPWGSQGGQKEF